jgi:2-haloalkanoic acid dehalogenase type II
MRTGQDKGGTDWEGVFLDFYGTVASGDVQAVEAVCQEVINDYDLKAEAPRLAVQWGHRFFAAVEAIENGSFQNLKRIETDTLIETLMPLCGRIDVQKYIRSFNDYLARPSLFQEVHEVLAALPVPICIVSNADDEELESALKHHSLRFEYVVTSEHAMSYKPDAKIFQSALKVTGWKAERVLHVGDSLHSDVGGAHRVGVRAAWVNRTTRISDIGTEEPEFTWTDLRPLVELTCGRQDCLSR